VFNTIDMDDANSQIMRAFHLSLASAKKSPMVRRHGASLFRGKVPTSTGYNSSRGVGWLTGAYSCHAEIAAMNGVDREVLDGADMMVVRTLRNGDIAMSKPCNNCEAALSRAGVRRVYFSIDNETIGVMRL
jgi:tRNA(Arg) A34 adenosine deaminase TadA